VLWKELVFISNRKFGFSKFYRTKNWSIHSGWSVFNKYD